MSLIYRKRAKDCETSYIIYRKRAKDCERSYTFWLAKKKTYIHTTHLNLILIFVTCHITFWFVEMLYIMRISLKNKEKKKRLDFTSRYNTRIKLLSFEKKGPHGLGFIKRKNIII